jgi:hypothetical protein
MDCSITKRVRERVSIVERQEKTYMKQSYRQAFSALRDARYYRSFRQCRRHGAEAWQRAASLQQNGDDKSLCDPCEWR